MGDGRGAGSGFPPPATESQEGFSEPTTPAGRPEGGIGYPGEVLAGKKEKECEMRNPGVGWTDCRQWDRHTQWGHCAERQRSWTPYRWTECCETYRWTGDRRRSRCCRQGSRRSTRDKKERGSSGNRKCVIMTRGEDRCQTPRVVPTGGVSGSDEQGP